MLSASSQQIQGLLQCDTQFPFLELIGIQSNSEIRPHQFMDLVTIILVALDHRIFNQRTMWQGDK
jgi:hypothetical protein